MMSLGEIQNDLRFQGRGALPACKKTSLDLTSLVYDVPAFALHACEESSIENLSARAQATFAYAPRGASPNVQCHT